MKRKEIIVRGRHWGDFKIERVSLTEFTLSFDFEFMDARYDTFRTYHASVEFGFIQFARLVRALWSVLMKRNELIRAEQVTSDGLKGELMQEQSF
jgi:hypothetical protein